MGWFGFKTKSEMNHELEMARVQNDAEQRKADANRAAEAKRQEEENRREKARIDSTEREGTANRKSEERKVQIHEEEETHRSQIEADTQLELARIENKRSNIEETQKTARAQAEQKGQTNRTNIVEMQKTARAQAEQKEETNRTNIRETQETARAQAEQKEETNRTNIRETQETARVQAEAERDVALAENERQIKIKALDSMKEIFVSYFQVVSESHKADIEALIAFNETRKAKFLASLESARSEKKHLLELSKEAKGQEKLDYLNESKEVEKTIRDLQEGDKEADEELMGKLALLRDTQQRAMEQGQDKLTMIDTNSLFLDYKGDAQR